MNIKIAGLMVKRAITAEPHHSLVHVHGVFERNRIHIVVVIHESAASASSARSTC